MDGIQKCDVRIIGWQFYKIDGDGLIYTSTNESPIILKGEILFRNIEMKEILKKPMDARWCKFISLLINLLKLFNLELYPLSSQVVLICNFKRGGK